VPSGNFRERKKAPPLSGWRTMAHSQWLPL
jgi:hypothetical protein